MGSVLSNQSIHDLVSNIPPLIDSYLSLNEQLQPNGFDLTLNNIQTIESEGIIGANPNDRVIPTAQILPFDDSDWIDLPRGSFLITFNEIVALPMNIMAFGRPRSSLLRSGVAIHTAVWDAGYKGRSQALLVVYNSNGYRVQKYARLMQLVFLYLDQHTTQSYKGTYQHENL
jgi:dUTP pyrophosphatase